MTQLLVQADDIAITHATTLGTLTSIEQGIVRSTGLFTNCPDAPFAAAELRKLDGVDVGIDLNFVTGRPVLPTSKVPSLVRADGAFRSSRDIKATHRVTHRDGYYLEFDPEPFDHDHTLAEARAQVQRFFDLMGRAPAYVHHHSIISTMSDRVLHEVASEFDLFVIDDLHRFSRVPLLPNDWYVEEFGPAQQVAADPLAAFERLLPSILTSELSLLITHPGYVDAELLDISTYSVIRARDLQLVTDPRVIATLADAGVELVNYSSARLDGVPLRDVRWADAS
jgi:predicted glycoside hydrolase/deacetylase ChbG (UPF0249 family)